MQSVHLAWVDYTILIAYTVFVIGIGFALRKYLKSSSDFLTSGRSIPAWVTGLAFISANLGALEVVGMAASGAQYGVATAHFYWVGAIPAMLFLAVFMMPFYYGSKARSVPEYLNMRFDGRVRCFNSISFAIMTVFASGISMDALARMLSFLLPWKNEYNIGGHVFGSYDFYLIICSAIVLVYVLKGGLTSAIYTEVLQFFMIVLGFAPVVWLGLKEVGGWSTLKEKLSVVAQNPSALYLGDKAYNSGAWSHAWTPIIAGPEHNPMGVGVFPIVFGLGFVLSFGYWCTNFLVVQRAMAARNMSAARRTPLIAAVPKMLFPAIVILPGMVAVALAVMPGKDYRLPPVAISATKMSYAVADVKAAAPDNAPAAVEKIKADVGLGMDPAKLTAIIQANSTSALSDDDLKTKLQDAVTDTYYNGVTLSLIERYCPAGLLGLALTALLASFMSGMAGNVTAFNTIWTYDLYQAYLAPSKTDRHYFVVGQASTVVGIILSIFCAYFSSHYSNAMNVIQLVFGFVNAPLFATFLLGMFWARTTGTGAFYGLIIGTCTSALFHSLTIYTGGTPGLQGAYLWHFLGHSTIPASCILPSSMAQNFWLASFAFASCFIFTTGISLATARTKTDEELKGLVYSLTPKLKDDETHFLLRPPVLATILLVCCVILNIIFW
ncbi:MAG TPA: sodium:solute symporter family protein [Pseudomonadales bacterium]|nr:sodium:solute symporter family protein [Pseudomonadales bacterium]